MWLKIILVFQFVCILPLVEGSVGKTKKNKSAISYPYNSYVDHEVWEMLEPYFLPINHPLKKKLDSLFKIYRITLSRECLIEAGFTPLEKPKKDGNLVVAKNPYLKGYLFKIYFDTQKVREWDNFYRRATGAESIKKYIQKHKLQHLFRVPQKWIYPIPLNSTLPNDPQLHRKNFILIVEDMHILNHHDNSEAFQTKVTRERLDELYALITHEGLIDSVFRGNIPFNEEGQMNFIDTEHHHRSPIPYHFLNRYLNPEMQEYWKAISHQDEL